MTFSEKLHRTLPEYAEILWNTGFKGPEPLSKVTINVKMHLNGIIIQTISYLEFHKEKTFPTIYG